MRTKNRIVWMREIGESEKSGIWEPYLDGGQFRVGGR